MIDGQNVFDQLIRKKIRTYDNIRKIATDQGHDYATGCLVDCNYFKSQYKVIAIDLRKQQPHDAEPKAIEQIYVT